MYSITEQMVDYITALGYRTSTYPSADAKPPFVTVERTGGYVEDLVDHPTMAVQTWAATEAQAEEMSLDIRDSLLLEHLPYGVHHAAVNSGPYPFWDESTRCARYQLVLDLTTQLID